MTVQNVNYFAREAFVLNVIGGAWGVAIWGMSSSIALGGVTALIFGGSYAMYCGMREVGYRAGLPTWKATAIAGVLLCVYQTALITSVTALGVLAPTAALIGAPLILTVAFSTYLHYSLAPQKTIPHRDLLVSLFLLDVPEERKPTPWGIPIKWR